ncbi:MAG: tetratricopeptide repeat protein, partial [Gemmatimonadetes bacterium]|nr:tetratricopeptide repeat protein [Gemmatimonadota bacterium]NIQ60047.1 tetratricopeptide repeat protein [Gemmatimonadota bacterium]NIU80265.1 tetratricopeptide repeat protein [Gammaproteobacteria bacterium]NIX48647.1 tetratricopeptide repeat protein [Gemmatimonadota bacterium]NIY13088.1 tetratricopeptide repeat protein [Gemmatimonadota bacterium]
AEAAPGAGADAAAVADGPSGETVAGLEPTAVEDAGERGGAGEPLEGFERADDDAVDEAEAAAGPVGGLEEVGAGEAVEDAPWATSPSEEEEGEDEIVWLTGPEAADPDATESAEVWEPELVEEAETRAEADEASAGSGAGETGAELPRGPGPEPLDAEASPWAVGGPDSERDEPEAAEPVGESAEADAAAWQEPRQEAPLPDEPGVMTETFAYVYARQGLYERAAEVYRELIRQRPDDDALRARLAEMEELAAEVRGQEAGLAADGDVDGAEELEGFESSEVDAGDVEAETLAGFEPEEVDYDTGLSAETTAGEAEPEPFADAVEVRDVPAPPEEEAPWGEVVGATEEAVGAEDEAVSVGEEPDHSPWTADDWSSPTEETPYAWAADETEDDTS